MTLNFKKKWILGAIHPKVFAMENYDSVFLTALWSNSSVFTLGTHKLLPDPLLCIVLQKLNYFTKWHTKTKVAFRNNCTGKMTQNAFSCVYCQNCYSFIWIISIYLTARDFSKYSEIPWVSKILHVYLLHGISTSNHAKAILSLQTRSQADVCNIHIFPEK